MTAVRCTGLRAQIQLAVLYLGLVFHTIAFTSHASAQDIASRPGDDLVDRSLDGMRFVGPFGTEAETGPEEDVFIFEDGTFVSASCRKFGFEPAPYWMRQDVSGLHFLAELKSGEHGTMRYEGVFDGKVMKAVAFWRKERLYWTIERTYLFTGEPSIAAK